MPERRVGQKGSRDVENNANASGVGAHAEGLGIASGTNAHAEGGSGSQAIGTNSHSEGTSYASGTNSHAQGDGCVATGLSAHAEGNGSTASGNYSHSEGYTTASGNYSHSEGYRAVASRYCQTARASFSMSAAGDSQASEFTAGLITTNATPGVLTFDQLGTNPSGGAATNVLTIPVNRAMRCGVDIIARRSDTPGDAAAFRFEAAIVRAASGDAAVIPNTDYREWRTAGAGAWVAAITIDTSDSTNNFLKITVTGEAAKTIRWMAHIRSVEVG